MWMKWRTFGAILLPLLLTPQAVAQEAPPPPSTNQTATPKPLWNITCTSAGGYTPMHCRMSQELFLAESGKKILTVTVDSPPKAQEAATMLFTLPHGLYLPAGITIKVDDGEARKLDIQTSDANGVYVGVALQEPLLTAVKRGRKITLTVTDANRKALNIPIGLEGFTAAFARIMALR
jgi:invasion protein IalB